MRRRRAGVYAARTRRADGRSAQPDRVRRVRWRCRAVAYGPDSQKQLDADFFRNFWKIQNPVTLVRKGMEYITEGWAEMSETLMGIPADGRT